ncbi:MAG: hypothetical protein ACLSVF_07125 [Faecalibacterium sp.]|jgi:hypothetical protein|uniref:Uncharacterized protein n=1 Tax=Faecalibacterium butyricigenerans TaxID=1851427 RepID=A0ABS8FAP6_9FIRM|nr:hypothetical protein [Faecalibacterium sp. CLA-AA-H233]MCC2200202.1 hypothetical protein [Faecalibacterium sp. CLA-AA-H233]
MISSSLDFFAVCRADYPQERGRKGVLAAPDYKAMYLELFRASEQAARLLQEAQARAEQQLLAADPPPIELAGRGEQKD